MKILVTGAGGFVGDALCRRLSASGCEVIGLFRDTPAPRDWMETRALGDLTQLDDFADVVGTTDAVVHLAARVHMMRDNAAELDPAYRQANACVTRRLARAAAASGAERFVFLSSVKVNGEETYGTPFREQDAPAPEDAYGRSKRDAEDALREIAATTSMAVTTLRVPLVYGAGVSANFGRLLRVCDTVLPLPLDGIRENRRSLLYLGNLTHALETILKANPNPAGTYFLSDGEDLSTATLICHLRHSLNRRAPRLPISPSIVRAAAAFGGEQGAVRRLCGSLQVDSTRFRKALGWTPPFSPAQGIAATVAAHRAKR